MSHFSLFAHFVAALRRKQWEKEGEKNLLLVPNFRQLRRRISHRNQLRRLVIRHNHNQKERRAEHVPKNRPSCSPLIIIVSLASHTYTHSAAPQKGQDERSEIPSIFRRFLNPPNDPRNFEGGKTSTLFTLTSSSKFFLYLSLSPLAK